MIKLKCSKSLFLGILLVILYNNYCYGQTLNTLEVYTKQKPIPFITDNFDVVDYIPLQTNSECLVKHIWTVKINEDKIFTFNNSSVHVWNMSGEFIGKIGKKGNGPGEMLMPSDFAISPDGKTVAIWDNYRETLNMFKITGEYLWSKKMGPRHVYNFCWTKSDKLIYYSNYSTKSSKECTIFLSDPNGKDIKQLLPFEKDEYGDCYMSYFNFPTYEAVQYVWKNLDNVIYALNNNEGLNACIKIEFDVGKLEKDKLTQYMFDPYGLFEAVKQNEFAYMTRFFENDNLYSITYNKGNRRSTNILLKANKKQLHIKHKPTNFDPISEFLPIFIEDTMILIVEPYKLKANLKNMIPAVKKQMGEAIQVLEKIAKQSSEEDNPVLLFLKLRE